MTLRSSLILTAVLLCPLACSAFSGSDNAPGQDAGAGAVPDGGVRNGLISVSMESSPTQHVAVNSQGIFWWSTGTRAIMTASKRGGSPVLVVSRAGQTVSALAVDDTSVFWVEVGMGDGGVTNRIMSASMAGTNVVVLYETAVSLQGLALTGARVAAPQLDVVSGINAGLKTGPIVTRELGLSSGVIGSDPLSFYYVYSDKLYAWDGSGSGGGAVCSGFTTGPSAVLAGSSSLYVLAPSSAGATLIKLAKTGPQEADAGASLATFASGTLFLALDPTGVVVGNAGDGTIVRVPALGGAKAPVAEGQTLNALAADPQGVYWTTDNGTVMWSHP